MTKRARPGSEPRPSSPKEAAPRDGDERNGRPPASDPPSPRPSAPDDPPSASAPPVGRTRARRHASGRRAAGKAAIASTRSDRQASRPEPERSKGGTGPDAGGGRPEVEPAAADGAAPADLRRLLTVLAARFRAADTDMVARAYELARSAHAGQLRASGDPYFTHPVAVAQILAEMGLDPPTVAAALLHDVLEDTDVGEATIREQAGRDVSRLVVGVTKITAIEAREPASAEAESMRRMFMAAADDLRVLLVKLADRLHNMRTVAPLSERRRRTLAEETLSIYAPLANRLGLWQLKSELEDLALQVLEPESYSAIEGMVAQHRSESEQYLASVIQQLDDRLREFGIEAHLSGRTKHYYSIYRKMQRKEVGPEQIFDILAVRVLVDDLSQCYLALGVLHTMWAPMQGEFDDYIAKPKTNFYQSLHTTVWGPENRPLEVQIRTHEMHEVAERGVAAHWLYKDDDPRAHDLAEKIVALRRLLVSTGEADADAETFVEGLVGDVFSDQVYVFTPKGDVVELPAGSTPVDFAYSIHSEVGHHCRGALVDGKMVSLDTPLQTGQTVKVIVAKGEAGPSRDWLNPTLGYVTTVQARSRIRQWFRRQERGAAIRSGRDVLERQLRKLGLTRTKHEQVARLFGYERLDDFLLALGRSEVGADAVGSRLLEAEDRGVTIAGTTEPTPAQVPVPVLPPTVPASGVSLRGADEVFTRIGRCCGPLPGEAVVGYVTRGRGVTLHRQDCRNISSLRAREPERFIQVSWRHDDRQSYPVELRVIAYDRAGLVRDISDVIAQRGVNMSSVSAVANPVDGTATVTAIVQIASHATLSALIDKLETIENVIEVRRPTG